MTSLEPAEQILDDSPANTSRKPVGFSAIGIFLFFGAVTASVSAIPLLWPGTFLDSLWTLNTKAYRDLVPFRNIAGFSFLLLGAALGMAGVGWFLRRLWGWRLAVGIIATQVLGDVVNCVRRDWLGGVTGVVIAGTLLLFLLRPRIRGAFT